MTLDWQLVFHVLIIAFALWWDRNVLRAAVSSWRKQEFHRLRAQKDVGPSNEGETMQFYDVKAKAKIEIPVSGITKTTIKTKNGLRYAFKAKTTDGRNLTRFASKTDYDSTNCPQG